MSRAFLTVLLNTKRETSNRSGHKVKRLYITVYAFSYNIHYRNFVAISKLVQWLPNLSDLDFDLSRSLKVKFNHANGLPIYGFSLMFNSNIVPN